MPLIWVVIWVVRVAVGRSTAPAAVPAPTRIQAPVTVPGLNRTPLAVPGLNGTPVSVAG
jgi:hypothetical protein